MYVYKKIVDGKNRPQTVTFPEEINEFIAERSEGLEIVNKIIIY